jgi:23S rRNA (cytosine1962-C5)-methyltransferase
MPASWITPELLHAFDSAHTDAHRVHSVPGCWIERFGRDYLISYTTPAQLTDTRELLEIWCATHRLPLDRIYGKHLADKEADRLPPALLKGDSALPVKTSVSENAVRYGLDFSASYSSGLFIDQRANRVAVRQQPTHKLLNTFSYTCSFSVAAALAKSETVSIDLSKKSLERGRDNFLLNGIDTRTDAQRQRHRFIADDVFGVIPYLKKRGETFDTIILDPPTFSRGSKAKTFRAERDFGSLLELALLVAAPRARILLSTNCTRLQRHDLESIVRSTLNPLRLHGTLQPGESLPDIPDAAMPTTVWLKLE